MIIVWDEPKRLENLARRGLDFAELDGEFFAHSMIVPARHGRHMAIGVFRGLVLSVIFKPLGTEGIAVISMRVASRKERKVL